MARMLANISGAFFCDGTGQFVPAYGSSGIAYGAGDTSTAEVSARRKDPIFWLDRLMEGGFELPDPEPGIVGGKSDRALVVLLTGPAGTGKSTFALELSMHWAAPCRPEEAGGLTTLYISSETNRQWPMQKADDLGWKERGRLAFHERHSLASPQEAAKSGRVLIDTTNKFIEYLTEGPKPLINFTQKEAVRIALKLTGLQLDAVKTVTDFVESLPKDDGRRELKETIEKEQLDVLVIDSLNGIGTAEGKREVLTKFGFFVKSRLKAIILILDSEAHVDEWAYLADVVIRFDIAREQGYLVRRLEVVKARYQSHVWGTHQLKFCKPARPLTKERSAAIVELCKDWRPPNHSGGQPDMCTLESLRDDLYRARQAPCQRRRSASGAFSKTSTRLKS